MKTPIRHRRASCPAMKQTRRPCHPRRQLRPRRLHYCDALHVAAVIQSFERKMGLTFEECGDQGAKTRNNIERLVRMGRLSVLQNDDEEQDVSPLKLPSFTDDVDWWDLD